MPSKKGFFTRQVNFLFFPPSPYPSLSDFILNIFMHFNNIIKKIKKQDGMQAEILQNERQILIEEKHGRKRKKLKKNMHKMYNGYMNNSSKIQKINKCFINGHMNNYINFIITHT